MKLSDLGHTALALVAVFGGHLTGHAEPAAVGAGFYFLGREIAQAEYRWIERYGQGLRANLPAFGAFEARVWDSHSWLWNLLLPVMAAGSLAAYLKTLT